VEEVTDVRENCEVLLRDLLLKALDYVGSILILKIHKFMGFEFSEESVDESNVFAFHITLKCVPFTCL
jgi:hypothetical protein